jgi:hypothetical protein
MAPLSRRCTSAVGALRDLYGLVRAILLFVVVALFFDLRCPTRTSPRALVICSSRRCRSSGSG